MHTNSYWFFISSYAIQMKNLLIIHLFLLSDVSITRVYCISIWSQTQLYSYVKNSVRDLINPLLPSSPWVSCLSLRNSACSPRLTTSLSPPCTTTIILARTRASASPSPRRARSTRPTLSCTTTPVPSSTCTNNVFLHNL